MNYGCYWGRGTSHDTRATRATTATAAAATNHDSTGQGIPSSHTLPARTGGSGSGSGGAGSCERKWLQEQWLKRLVLASTSTTSTGRGVVAVIIVVIAVGSTSSGGVEERVEE